MPNNKGLKMTLQQLTEIIGDLYKEAYGVRPHHFTEAQWNDVAFLEMIYEQCLDALGY